MRSSRRNRDPVIVESVAPGSIADELELQPGVQIETINGQPIRDSVDYMYAVSGEEKLDIQWQDPGGERFEAHIVREPDEELGISLRAQPVRVCRNRCTFCFVDQMPRGLRKTLYVKDDDWRSSFLHGTYVTLTNLTEEDVARITEQRISPLYVSVHATDDSVRAFLMGDERGRSTFGIVRDFAKAGIRMHTQAVVCEGDNDGEVLERTIDDLFRLHPAVQSLSVVPVGLTRFRDGLPKVKRVSVQNAARIVDMIEERQKRFLEESGTRFVFASDELYLRSGRPLPSATEYEDFVQIENGVGLIADFEQSARDELARARRRSHVRVLVMTGEGFAGRLGRIAEEAEEALGVSIDILGVKNEFFGPCVNVAGLLTGSDVLREIPKAAGYDALFVPAVMFRDAGDRSLDDVTFSEIERAVGIPCFRGGPGGDEFIRQLASVP